MNKSEAEIRLDEARWWYHKFAWPLDGERKASVVEGIDRIDDLEAHQSGQPQPTQGPCSACGDGDVEMEYHSHETQPPLEFHKPGQIPVNTPVCDRCGKMFLECQCAALSDLLEKFRCDLIDGSVIKESDGDPWPLSKNEAAQVVAELAKRLTGTPPSQAGAMPCPKCAENEALVQRWQDAYFQDEGVTPEGELRPLVSKLVKRTAELEARGRHRK